MDPKHARSPERYIALLEEPRKSEIRRLHELIRRAAPGLEPHMQSGMIGYGRYHYRYASGREGDWSRISLASQKNYISLYVMATKDGRYLAETYAERLPRANIGRSCVRLRKLEHADLGVIEGLVREAAALTNPR